VCARRVLCRGDTECDQTRGNLADHLLGLAPGRLETVPAFDGEPIDRGLVLSAKLRLLGPVAVAAEGRYRRVDFGAERGDDVQIDCEMYSR
jgi:hypothetical protein